MTILQITILGCLVATLQAAPSLLGDVSSITKDLNVDDVTKSDPADKDSLLDGVTKTVNPVVDDLKGDDAIDKDKAASQYGLLDSSSLVPATNSEATAVAVASTTPVADSETSGPGPDDYATSTVSSIVSPDGAVSSPASSATKDTRSDGALGSVSSLNNDLPLNANDVIKSDSTDKDSILDGVTKTENPVVDGLKGDDAIDKNKAASQSGLLDSSSLAPATNSEAIAIAVASATPVADSKTSSLGPDDYATSTVSSVVSPDGAVSSPASSATKDTSSDGVLGSVSSLNKDLPLNGVTDTVSPVLDSLVKSSPGTSPVTQGLLSGATNPVISVTKSTGSDSPSDSVGSTADNLPIVGSVTKDLPLSGITDAVSPVLGGVTSGVIPGAGNSPIESSPGTSALTEGLLSGATSPVTSVTKSPESDGLLNTVGTAVDNLPIVGSVTKAVPVSGVTNAVSPVVDGVLDTAGSLTGSSNGNSGLLGGGVENLVQPGSDPGSNGLLDTVSDVTGAVGSVLDGGTTGGVLNTVGSVTGSLPIVGGVTDDLLGGGNKDQAPSQVSSASQPAGTTTSSCSNTNSVPTNCPPCSSDPTSEVQTKTDTGPTKSPGPSYIEIPLKRLLFLAQLGMLRQCGLL